MHLNRFNLVVIGAGVLGCAVLTQMVGRYFSSVSIVDGDIVTQKNLKNQRLYSEKDAAEMLNKSRAAVVHLSALNSSVKYNSFPFYIGEQRILGVIKGADLVLDFTDNSETRLIINDACFKFKIPLLIASIRGKNGFFYLIDWKHACYNCIYTNLQKSYNENCANTHYESAMRLGALIEKELSRFIAGDNGFLFNSVSLNTNRAHSIEIAKDPHCGTCGASKHMHSLDHGFIQACGDGLKFSSQHKIDLRAVCRAFPAAIKKANRQAVFLGGVNKHVLISRTGDFLFTGYSRNEALHFISRLSGVNV